MCSFCRRKLLPRQHGVASKFNQLDLVVLCSAFLSFVNCSKMTQKHKIPIHPPNPVDVGLSLQPAVIAAYSDNVAFLINFPKKKKKSIKNHPIRDHFDSFRQTGYAKPPHFHIRVVGFPFITHHPWIIFTHTHKVQSNTERMRTLLDYISGTSNSTKNEEKIIERIANNKFRISIIIKIILINFQDMKVCKCACNVRRKVF
jgi:hypothetical protein